MRNRQVLKKYIEVAENFEWCVCARVRKTETERVRLLR